MDLRLASGPDWAPEPPEQDPWWVKLALALLIGIALYIPVSAFTYWVTHPALSQMEVLQDIQTWIGW